MEKRPLGDVKYINHLLKDYLNNLAILFRSVSSVLWMFLGIEDV